MTTDASGAPPSAWRRLATGLYRRPRLQLWLILALPAAWLGLAYFGSLVVLFLNAFWSVDSFTGKIIPQFTLESFEHLLGTEVYRTIALRTIAMAAVVTLTDALLAFPIAYYMARVASPRTRRILVVAVLLPLWASYLVKVYAWRTILHGGGALDWVLAPIGLEGPGFGDVANWLVFSYLWLPYMILPIFAGLERIPASMLEASADLGGRAWTTFRRVVLPLALPAVVAGSIFTFSLTLGDYIVPSLVSNTKFIGNVINDNSSIGNEPLAAAFALVPVLVMVVYLLVARRLGAFESL
jgi:putative spermidine/putrescine transport system permease protein